MKPRIILLVVVAFICFAMRHSCGDSQTVPSIDVDRALQRSLQHRFWANGVEVRERGSLAGKDQFTVLLNLEDEIKKYGITDLFVQTAIELRLRKEGIKTQEGPPPEGVDVLMRSRYAGLLTLTIAGSGDEVSGLTSIIVSASFYQHVALLGTDTPVFALASTWNSYPRVMLVGTHRVREACERSLEGIVDEFTREWLATHGDQAPKLRDPQYQGNSDVPESNVKVD